MKTDEAVHEQLALRSHLKSPRIDPERRVARGAGILVQLSDGDESIGMVCASFIGREHEIGANYISKDLME